MPKRWLIRSHDPARIHALSQAANISAVTAQLLIHRGLCDPVQAQSFLSPRLTDLREPEALPGAVAAAEKIHCAAREGRRIVIYGDYDVDGITGTSILVKCLRLIGANVGYYLPDRMEEGYGLNHEALRTLARQGAQLVVTVDCGITSVAQAQTARELGVDLVITDHHEMAAALPDAAALVHPQLPPQPCEFTGISGAGVAFKVAWAICQLESGARRVSPALREFLKQAVVLASLGAVADVVPLIDENRALVHYGLQGLQEAPGVGLQKLLEVSQLQNSPRLTSEHIGFQLAPRLNAAGRLGQARLAVELLTTENEARAVELAQYVDNLNAGRKTLERSIFLAASKQAKELYDPENDAALVLAERGWHPGVIGIVAGRLADRFHRPVVVVTLDDLGQKPGAGSARSVPGFALHEALAACSSHLLTHGGHAAAAGLTIAEANLENFRAEFCELAAQRIPPEGRIAQLAIDAETLLSSLTLRTVEQLDRLAPFGAGNRRPLLCASKVRLVGPPRKIGGGERHLSLQFEQAGITMRGIAFGGADWADELTLAAQQPLDVAFQPQINVFRGQRSVELEIVDWRPSAEPNARGDARSGQDSTGTRAAIGAAVLAPANGAS